MVRDGYKQTELGEIPEDWEVKELISLCSMKSGLSITSASLKDGAHYPCYGGNGLRGHTHSYTHEGEHALIGRQGALCGNVNGVNGKFYASEHAIVVTPNKDTEIHWLTYILRRMDLNQYSESSAQPGLSVNKLLPLKVIAPQLKAEQKKIAEAISDVDDLIFSMGRLINKKRDIKTSTMQQLLTGEKRLPGFQGGWSKVSMERDAELNARIGWQALTTKEYLHSGDYFLVTGTDFINGRINWNSCHYVDEWRYSQDRKIQLKEGDVLLTKDGTIGKVGYVDSLSFPATLNSGVFVIRPRNDSFDSLFLFYILMSRFFDEFLSKITAGSTITHLYQKDFVTFDFYAPDLDEQKEISKILFDMDEDIKAHEDKLKKVKALKEGMMQELLTGRTRLVNGTAVEVVKD